MRWMALAGAVALAATASTAQRGDNTAVWDHLAKTYDENGDGVITAAEHGRGEAQFKNLDRNGDGEITAADFERRGRGGGGGGGGRRGGGAPQAAAAERVAMLARQLGDMYGSFLNRDGKPGIDEAEWQRIVESLEPDDDGTIAEDKLANLTGLSGRGRMARFAGNGLQRALDFDRDERVTVTDMKAVFAALDANGDGNIEQGAEIDLPPGVGEMAPDFTLPHASDKSKTVTLSSFRGKKPVALIFGSYT